LRIFPDAVIGNPSTNSQRRGILKWANDCAAKASSAAGLGVPSAAPSTKVTNAATWSYVKGRVVGRGSYGLFNGKLYVDKG